MTIDIFRLDWILIDSIIIILLFLALISVKIFKERSRWNASLSNKALEIINYTKSDIKLKSLYVSVKNWSFIRNNKLKEEFSSKPTIIIVKPNKKRKLIYALTEGLASNGFEVIILNIKVSPCKGCNILDNTMQKEMIYVFSTILNFFKQNDLISSSNYILMNYLKSYFSYKSILSDSNNYGMFLLNPRLNSINIRNLSEISKLTNLKSLTYVIFSKKSNSFFTNQNLKKFFNLFPTGKTKHLRVLTLEKAKLSFKYYETILLGIIIYLIKKISSKS